MKTNDCTGPRYEGEFQELAAITDWHGKFGHLNVSKRDHDSIETGFGKHDRVVAFLPRVFLEIRVDHVWNLGEPTIKEILHVARKDQDIKGNWELIEKIKEGGSTFYTFKRKGMV